MFLKNLRNYSSVSAALTFAVSATEISANDWSIAPFALYERAPENIIVDGVSTKYGLGVIGGQVTYSVPGTVSLSARIGYGQNDDKEVSFSGATINGKVTRTYLEAKAQKSIVARGNILLSLEGGYSERDIKADDLIRSRNGLALTGQSVSSISSFDLMLNLQQNVTDRLSATATSGQDPIYKLGFDYTGDKSTIHARISQKALLSKANTDIITGELIVTFDF